MEFPCWAEPSTAMPAGLADFVAEHEMRVED
jgi:hypothetical protein